MYKQSQLKADMASLRVIFRIHVMDTVGLYRWFLNTYIKMFRIFILLWIL